MKTKTLALAATILGALALGAGTATAAPLGVNGMQADQSGMTQSSGGRFG